MGRWHWAVPNIQWLAGAAVLPLLLTLGGLAQAQAQSTAIERNVPAAPASTGAAFALAASSAGSTDTTPFGVDVAGIALIGGNAAASAHPARGISFTALPDADWAGLEEALAPFIGQPLSAALIADVQAAVAGVWRAAGYPFMSVTVPPQEVTSGVLTLRVVAFTAGTIAIDPAGTSADLRAHIRQQSGAAISAPQLSEDLAWLNRNSFRQVGAVFAPGDQHGASDIQLSVSALEPISLYAGWDNSGSPASGRDRWFIGGGAWIPALNDLTLSWQLTRSGEVWSGGEVFSLDPTRPDYLSLAGRIDLPTLPRQALSFAPNFVASNELVAGTPFSFETTTLELPLLYRTAVSNIWPERHWGDVYFGIEPKWLSRQTRFAGTVVAEGDVGLVNLVVGWSHQLVDPSGHTGVDLYLKANPGGLIATNTAADWSAFTGGRVTDPGSAYLGFDITRLTNLPQGFNWVSTLSGQVAGQALPDPERLSLGGHAAVRGYAGSDAGVDAGVVWRNELRIPTLTPLQSAGFSDNLSPFTFLDLGWGRDIAAATATTLASTGLGFDYAIGRNFNAGATAAVALSDAGSTTAGDWTVTGKIRFTY